jgi:hypothetical protein
LLDTLSFAFFPIISQFLTKQLPSDSHTSLSRLILLFRRAEHFVANHDYDMTAKSSLPSLFHDREKLIKLSVHFLSS